MAKLTITLDPATDTELGGILSSSADQAISVDAVTGVATLNGMDKVGEILDLISGEVV
jgi:hypothetical protein